ncbi:hypothetical protein HN51_044200 [Arachis hypogaea]
MASFSSKMSLNAEKSPFQRTYATQAATKVLGRQLVRLTQQIANLQGSRAQMRGIATHTQVLTATKIRYWRNAIDSSLLKQWLHNLQSEIGILADGTLTLRQVLIQVPGIVFARGPAVTVLILLESDGETYVVLTKQARVPTGRIILELPARMLDDDKGDFVGTAVEEETGIKFKLEDMVDLTAFLDSSTGCRFFPLLASIGMDNLNA